MGRQKWRGTIPAGIKIGLLGVGLIGSWVGWQVVRRSHIAQQNRNLKTGRKILILGGGFAGANVAQELANLLPAPQDAEIILVDEKDYLLFTPMLTEVAGGQVEASHTVRPLRTLSPRITFEQGRIVSVDLAAKRVTITIGTAENGIPEKQRTLTADHLVIALGAVPDFHRIPGIEEHALTVKDLMDAAIIRNRILTIMERADEEADQNTRRELLTFVVGGGGYTGVEIMASINDLIRDSIERYPRIQPDDIRTVLIVPEDKLLTELNEPSLAVYAQRKLKERGVEVLLNTKITGADADYVELAGGQRIQTHTLIWAAGIAPSPIIGTLNCKRGKHDGIVVDACCAVPDYPGVWALGDCAEIPEPDRQHTYAPTAQNATREGIQVARNIAAALRDEEPQPFSYTPIGELALVGKRSGIAKVYGVNVSGFPAWAMWRAIYLMKTPGASPRVHILLDWLLDLVFGRTIIELPARPESQSPTLTQAHPR